MFLNQRTIFKRLPTRRVKTYSSYSNRTAGLIAKKIRFLKKRPWSFAPGKSQSLEKTCYSIQLILGTVEIWSNERRYEEKSGCNAQHGSSGNLSSQKIRLRVSRKPIWRTASKVDRLIRCRLCYATVRHSKDGHGFDRKVFFRKTCS